MLSSANLAAALERVETNRGAPGVDGVTTADLRGWLREHWEGVREELDAGRYRPSPVRRVMIPKPGGGERMLGVPTVLDRLIQQAIAQVLTPIFDPEFSGSSFGFRPGRSAHQAVRVARRAIEDGHRWVVDIDLDRFFDRVQHDVLMARVARRVDDRRVLRLIRSFLEAGIMADGVKMPSAQGTPQGSPLSPVLSNIMLDDLDRELWRRGHRFVRYADDIRVFTRSRRAAHRVLDSITVVVEQRLKLKVNREKSKVVPASVATLLGFGFYFTRAGVRIRVDPKALRRWKVRIRELTSRRWSVAMEYRIGRLNRFIVGWMGYFRLADTPRVFQGLDEWLRRRMRQVRWKEWKRARTRRRMLRSLGISDRVARDWVISSKGYWRIGGSVVLQQALPNSYWEGFGLRMLKPTWQRLRSV
ncbi:group II intron reverse transcriptase/maturase [Nocardiopsis metallicus]|uniref:RNA-directed DNA polymerase n=1 Tax=Nocardiopsis metallicus TaxID=179819 RepID=A0A840WQJ9_9ACTN|nr:group II intron reverse transcriptase/maturase [Nocardiopsis metallicus]MBB5489350.1 group II intron reverse transcriptase/maturase [Nocardiopsis metallicus]MBB5490969.1 group II intron reverse transcriptase/maturase [Nocardiopsis metallicus]MBB5493442.1 group II intron reverse transcriptase/maturase [Nocardiopsis metallicus]MBB5493796.1 group II intron reverse transcriptase/maturase [Nocardiopsis metallicus]MBB5493976.1 group II intron reverse transcriptase/maturase [Nocardiopsis metallicu